MESHPSGLPSQKQPIRNLDSVIRESPTTSVPRKTTRQIHQATQYLWNHGIQHRSRQENKHERSKHPLLKIILRIPQLPKRESSKNRRRQNSKQIPIPITRTPPIIP